MKIGNICPEDCTRDCATHTHDIRHHLPYVKDPPVLSNFAPPMLDNNWNGTSAFFSPEEIIGSEQLKPHLDGFIQSLPDWMFDIRDGKITTKEEVIHYISNDDFWFDKIPASVLGTNPEGGVIDLWETCQSSPRQLHLSAVICVYLDKKFEMSGNGGVQLLLFLSSIQLDGLIFPFSHIST